MELLNALEWRYATKNYDPSKKIDQSLVDQIIKAAWLAPSSSGLQPFKILEITNQEIKEKIGEIAYMNKQRISDSSHLLVFVAWDNYTEERIDHIYKYTTEARKQPEDAYKEYTDMLKEIYLNRDSELNFDHTARQSYIAFGLAIGAAAELKVDATPVEGFDSAALDEILNLKEQGLRSVTMLPLGYRDENNDWLAKMAKVRHPKEEFLIKIK